MVTTTETILLPIRQFRFISLHNISLGFFRHVIFSVMQFKKCTFRNSTYGESNNLHQVADSLGQTDITF